LTVQGYQLVVRGTFASYFKAVTLMSEPVELLLSGDRRISAIELFGNLTTPLIVDGAALLTSGATEENCPLTLRRLGCDI